MPTRLATHSADADLGTTARYLRQQFCMDDMSRTTERRGGGRAALVQFEPDWLAAVRPDELSSLEALPWLTRAGPSSGAVHEDAGPIRSGNTRILLRAGIAAALAAIVGGAWLLGGGTVPQPTPSAVQSDLVRGNAPAAPLAAADTPGASTAKTLGKGTTKDNVSAHTRQALMVDRVGSEPRFGAARMKREAAAPIATSLAAEQMAGTDTADTASLPLPPAADSPATAATLREYRSAVEECRDAIRAVIRLGDRKRPGRSASSEEQTSYRLRQQNAEAAKGYRSYLDTLARSMRGPKSETFARQSLERARQTLGYVSSMLADSQSSLR